MPTAVISSDRTLHQPALLRRLVLPLVAVFGAAMQEMSFLDHLEELRRRILWSVAAIVAAFALCWIFASQLYELAGVPLRSHPAVMLSLSRPQDIVSLHVKVTLTAAIFLAAPIVLTQAWLFIAPGLYRHERRYAIPFVVAASVLFLCGGAFAYFIAFPTALRFLLDWIVESRITPIIDAVEYFDLFFTITVAFGLVFQIPAMILVLSRIGLVTPGWLARRFKHAIVGSLVVAAIITPTTDFANMFLVAGPMILLYAVGIGVAWMFPSGLRTEQRDDSPAHFQE